MTAVLRWTGIGKLVSLYLLVVNRGVPVHLSAYFAVLAAAAVLAALGMLTGCALGWALGSLVSAVAIAMHVASRALDPSGLPQLVDRWDHPLGTFSMALAVLVLALHFSVLTGMNVAYPQRRRWR